MTTPLDSTGDISVEEQQHPLLYQLLPKLRPFQREALEFAVTGKRHARQMTTTATENENYKSTTFPSEIQQELQTNSPINPQGRILLADEMGLGKTITSLAIMSYYESEWSPLLILCPASLRYSWPAEIEKFLPQIPSQSIYVVQGFQDVKWLQQLQQQHSLQDSNSNRKNHHSMQNIKVLVVTYSLFQNRSAVSHAISEHSHLFQCIIADESHHLKTGNSQRSEILLPILQQCRRLVLLSGTPALARPVELYSQLAALDASVFGSFRQFTKAFCNPKKVHIGRGRYRMDYGGSSNERELHNQLRQVMVRRLKSTVLHELPPKQRSVVEIEISKDQIPACAEAMRELEESRRNNSNNNNRYDTRDEALLFSEASSSQFSSSSLQNPKVALMKAYQQTGIGKAASIAEYLVNVWLPGSTGKILVFAHHQTVMDTLENALLRMNSTTTTKSTSRVIPNSHIRIDGSVSPTMRAQLVKKFQTTPSVRVALLSMTAAGVGLTLTAASTVLFAELHWTPGVLAQAEDRAHRIGQRDNVQILYMVHRKNPKLSVDRILWNMLGRKIHTIDQIVDGKEDSTPYLFSATRESSGDEPTSRPKSAQEELYEFFAEEATTNTAQKGSTQPPVKGSIQSFFQKAATATQKTTNNQSSVRSLSSRSKTPTVSGSSSKAQEMIAGVAQSRSHADTLRLDDTIVDLTASPNTKLSNITWNCSLCTFQNTKAISSNACYTCEMCGEPHLPEIEDEEVTDNRTSLKAENRAEQQSSSLSISPELPNLKGYARVSFSPKEYLGQHETRHHSKKRKLGPVEVDKGLGFCNASEVAAVPSEKNCSIVPSDDESTLRIDNTKNIPPNLLSFSVSKNTGRITVHFSSGRINEDVSTIINFDIQDVTLEETDEFKGCSNARTKATKRKRPAFQFDEAKVQLIVDRIRKVDSSNSHNLATFRNEVKEFVANYVNLRDVEKRALQDSGRPHQSSNLSQAAAQLLAATYQAETTDRFIGGAKERAMDNFKNGVPSEQDHDVLSGLACAWCGNKMSRASRKSSSVYCSEECAVDGRLRRGGMFASSNLRKMVFAMEGGKCSLCGIDAQALYEQIVVLHPPERLNRLLAVNWPLPKSSKSLESLLQNPTEGNFWQVDHIKAVVEGGGGCGLENLRTLCVPCHANETRKLHHRIQFQNNVCPGGTKRKEIQTDIRTAFASVFKEKHC